jgi:hypothetical protein
MVPIHLIELVTSFPFQNFEMIRSYFLYFNCKAGFANIRILQIEEIFLFFSTKKTGEPVQTAKVCYPLPQNVSK